MRERGSLLWPPHGFQMDDLGHSFNQPRGVLVRVQRALHPGDCPRVGPSSRATGAVSESHCVASHDQAVCNCLRELAPSPGHENEHHPNGQSAQPKRDPSPCGTSLPRELLRARRLRDLRREVDVGDPAW